MKNLVDLQLWLAKGQFPFLFGTEVCTFNDHCKCTVQNVRRKETTKIWFHNKSLDIFKGFGSVIGQHLPIVRIYKNIELTKKESA